MSNLFRLYLRVLGQLGPQARVGWLLALAGLGLPAAPFRAPRAVASRRAPPSPASDRRAPRRRPAVLTDNSEHTRRLPLSYHGGVHSGRLLKVMLAGTD